jgi:uncharacterized protein (DUF58 family)
MEPCACIEEVVAHEELDSDRLTINDDPSARLCHPQLAMVENSSDTSSRPPLKPAFSLPGALSIVVGLALLFAFWKFSVRLTGWGVRQRLALFAVATLLFVWGGKQLASGWIGRSSGFQRNRVALPGSGIIFLLILGVLFVGAMLGRSNMLMLVFSLMAGPFILNGWVTFSMLKRLKVTRRVPARVMAGEPFSIEIGLENCKRWMSSRIMEVRESIENATEQLNAGVLFARVPPRGRRTAHYRLNLMRRGRYVVGPTIVATRFPLGIIERGLLLDDRDEILVLPRVGNLLPRWKRTLWQAAQLVQRPQPQSGTFDDEFHRLREYRHGDNPRAIHWRSSAKKNELMVREYHQDRDPNLTLLLDLWQPEHPDDDDLERIELAISFAATICVDRCRNSHGSRIRVVIAGREFSTWDNGLRTGLLESVLETLAVAEPFETPDLRRLRSQANAVAESDSRTVLISTRPRDGASFEELNTSMTRTDTSDPAINVETLVASSNELAEFFQID